VNGLEDNITLGRPSSMTRAVQALALCRGGIYCAEPDRTSHGIRMIVL
jgi:hypothetical protein